MVGLNGCPRLFGNALDDHRRVLVSEALLKTGILGFPLLTSV